jgi:hypothetical protein
VQGLQLAIDVAGELGCGARHLIRAFALSGYPSTPFYPVMHWRTSQPLQPLDELTFARVALTDVIETA